MVCLEIAPPQSTHVTRADRRHAIVILCVSELKSLPPPQKKVSEAGEGGGLAGEGGPSAAPDQLLDLLAKI